MTSYLCVLFVYQILPCNVRHEGRKFLKTFPQFGPLFCHNSFKFTAVCFIFLDVVASVDYQEMFQNYISTLGFFPNYVNSVQLPA